VPFIKVANVEGENPELVSRTVDAYIERPLGEEGKDSQLDVAIECLLNQIDGK